MRGQDNPTRHKKCRLLAAACLFSWPILSVCLVVPAGGAEKIAVSIEDIFAKSAPSVVKIYGASLGRQQGYGTGTLISSDGKILTQNSVLLSSPTIRIVLSDGRKYDATILRQDERHRLALLKIDVSNLPFLSPVDSSELKQGDTVLALGNWFKIADGSEQVSLTRGMFSIKTRIDTRRLAQEYEYDSPVLIYDAITANPGAAGGPLLDASGGFVGLVGTIVESAFTNTRINYAIPGEDLLAFLKDEHNEPHVSADSTHRSDLAEAKSQNGASPDVGVVLSRLGYRQVSAFVEKVRRDSPAAKAGIKTDDLIMAIDSRRIGSAEDYQKALAQLLPGQKVQFIVKRGEQVLTLELTVGAAR